MNKEHIRSMFDQVLAKATEEDLTVLSQLIDGLAKKQATGEPAYFKDFFNMEGRLLKDACEITIPVTPLLYNTFSIVHGGVTATLVDTAMGFMANSMLPEGKQAVTSNLTIHYIAPGSGKWIKARAEVIHRGSKTMVLEGTVCRDDGTKIAHCTGSFFIL
ncbi:PaaI family thioesterase [Heyndrickxia acidiproducens]|uniref:PaaI family thioesterase n=1 Tax=Heyndrickxia acidiproducens TaxID=1121084 RepID=UPI000376C933|nr:PaaI family thioesterase [Heyndrickxia acidiproducens]